MDKDFSITILWAGADVRQWIVILYCNVLKKKKQTEKNLHRKERVNKVFLS